MIRQHSRSCWFCDQRCYEFVSICSDCKQTKKRKHNILTEKQLLDNNNNEIICHNISDNIKKNKAMLK